MPLTPPRTGHAPMEDEHGIEVVADDDLVILTVRGCLDEGTGGALLEAVRAAAESSTPRLDIDLRQVESFTLDGANALLGCREIAEGLPQGLHYRTGRGPGREALLVAYGSSD